MNTPKRIIITGASGVGKTTIVDQLSSRLSLPAIPELARDICKTMGYERIGDIPEQEAFKNKVLDSQIEEEEKLGAFISDRSTIDCWVLWQRWNICSAMTYDTESYYERSRTQAQKYTHIIYIPPMFPAVDDGFRWTEPDYQKQIDRLVRMTLYDFNLWERTYTMVQKDVDERLNEAQKWLDN